MGEFHFCFAQAWQGQTGMAGASPATTIDGRRRSQRGIVVAPLAGAMKPHAKI
jgi:hypothetical protein